MLLGCLTGICQGEKKLFFTRPQYGTKIASSLYTPQVSLVSGDSVEDSKKPVANPSVLLREEFDDWAVLYDPDTGHGFGLSPIGVYLWKLLDGEHSIDEMLSALRRDAADVPQEAGEQILTFVEELTQHGLVTDNAEQVHDGRERILLRTTGIAKNLPDGGREAGQLGSGILPYERPRLEPLTLERRAQGSCSPGAACCNSGSNDDTGCQNGNSAIVSSGYGCHTTGNNASGGQWACGAGYSATGGSSRACTDGFSATGSNSCNAGYNGGSCISGGTAV